LAGCSYAQSTDEPSTNNTCGISHLLLWSPVLMEGAPCAVMTAGQRSMFPRLAQTHANTTSAHMRARTHMFHTHTHTHTHTYTHTHTGRHTRTHTASLCLFLFHLHGNVCRALPNHPRSLQLGSAGIRGEKPANADVVPFGNVMCTPRAYGSCDGNVYTCTHTCTYANNQTSKQTTKQATKQTNNQPNNQAS
jgi:hypothetical protein